MTEELPLETCAENRDLCSPSLIARLIAVRPVLHSGQGVHPGDLQGLHYHKANMHTQYLSNDEDIEFPKVSSAKQMPENNREAKHIGRLESLAQFHLGSELDKECSIVFYNPCAAILLTCTS
jgi:hypothetical protein